MTPRLKLIREAQKDGAEGGTAWRDRLDRWLRLQEETITIRLGVQIYETNWGKFKLPVWSVRRP